MANEIKAIPTCYKGIPFRSRLEARWAIIFDQLGIDWHYETEGYDIPTVLAGACVSAGYNAMQYGVWPLFTEDIREEAARLRDELANRVIMIDV